MKKHLRSLAIGCSALFTLSGCYEIDQIITVQKDGSGTIVDTVVLNGALIPMIVWEKNPDEVLEKIRTDLYAEEQYRKVAAQYGKGVTFWKLEKIEDKDMPALGVKVYYKFTDINNVEFEPILSKQRMGDVKMPGSDPAKPREKQPIKFRYSNGNLAVTFPKESQLGKLQNQRQQQRNKPEKKSNALGEEIAEEFLKQLKIGIKLVFEPGIASTNATHVEGNAITLFELNMARILNNPEGIKIFDKLDLKAAGQKWNGLKVESKTRLEVRATK